MSRRNLLHSMETLARKRQKEFDEVTKWADQTQYYRNWDRHNSQYQSWTSNDYYKHSMSQYDSLKTEQQKKEHLEKRRDKLRQLFFEEEQQYDLEVQCSPRTYQRSHYKLNETPTEVLKDVNIGIKLAEDDRRRHEAELKLYQQWKNENPIIRNYESSQNKSSMKLAWLDQQIEKRMQQEKQDEEMKKMIEERDRLIKEEERLEQLENEETAKREKELMSDIELQMRHFRLKDEEAESLKREESFVMKKKQQIEDLIQKNKQELQQRNHRDIALYNINQSKIRLRKKATEVEEQLKKEQQLIEKILASQAADEIENESKRAQTKNSIQSFLNYIREQRNLEEQRQKYISFVFDSEAKNLWEKQDRLWKEEQQARDKLLQDVLKGIQGQIEEKLTKNLEKQRDLLFEREEMLQMIEDQDKMMKKCAEDDHQKKMERKHELDKQVNEKKLIEYEKKLEEDRKKKEELDKIRKEEEKLKHELMRMQTRQHPQTRFHRRILW